jgi:DNA-binding transcriptional MerR regulator
VVVQANFKSTVAVDHMTIGQAAERLGLKPSALRYYDERGLVPVPVRRAGRRMYGPDELRRLAFIKIGQRLGLPLDTAAEVFDAPGPQWRHTVGRQIEQLEEVIIQARAAQRFLSHALHCPSDHPTRECPVMVAGLDRLVEGETVEQLIAEHGSSPPADHTRTPTQDQYNDAGQRRCGGDL